MPPFDHIGVAVQAKFIERYRNPSVLAQDTAIASQAIRNARS